ncbi:hypothetical protein LBMAG53_12870 [Planctomycetota bacterium]|nr:hypothetical protein LBMAG53_12870 [Planctomycetota bacterium]
MGKPAVRTSSQTPEPGRGGGNDWIAHQIAAIRAWSNRHLPHDGALLWFAEPGIPMPLDIERSGLGLCGGDLLAAAAGAAVASGAHPAWTECLGADRRGVLSLPTHRPARVAVVLWRRTLSTTSGLTALALVCGLGAVVDLMVVDGTDDDGERLSRLGLKPIGQAWAPCENANVCWSGSDADPHEPQDGLSANAVRQEWPPVHLASLPAGLVAPSMDRGMSPNLAIDTWLMQIAADEPRLILPHHHGWWPQQPADGATLQALAQLACSGWRVVWRLPAGLDLTDWAQALDAVGASGAPIKLLVQAADLPEVGWWMERRGWWCIAPADADETAAVLLWALAHEDSVVVGLPPAGSGISAWPSGTAWMPGSGRWILGGPDDPHRAGTLVCRADRVHRALTYHRPGEGVFCCTSLWPLPVEELRRAARRGPLRVAARLHSAVVAALADEPEIQIERWGA